jgi:hypothetical protein
MSNLHIENPQVVQPAEGTNFYEGGYGVVDNRFYSRGPLVCVLVRDNQGASTNISPYIQGESGPQLNWSPLAADGTLRADLFADVQIDGEWFINTDPNEGFWRIGAFDEKAGPDRKGSIKHDDQMIVQSNFPFDTDLTGEGITIQFTGIESFKPAMMRLRMNLPLVDDNGNNLVEDVGQPNYVISKPVDYDSPNRQILCVFARQRPGGYIYSVEGYPLGKLTDLGNMKRSKTDPDAPSLSFTALPDPFHTDIDATDPDSGQVAPAFYSQWIGGAGWAAMYESGS